MTPTLTKKQRREIVAELRERAKFSVGEPSLMGNVPLPGWVYRNKRPVQLDNKRQRALYRDLLAEAIEQGDLP